MANLFETKQEKLLNVIKGLETSLKENGRTKHLSEENVITMQNTIDELLILMTQDTDSGKST